MRLEGSPSHRYRTSVLTCLSNLTGCREELPSFPGAWPDVLRVDRSRLRVFIGDAKHTETPQGLDTRARLAKYVDAALQALEAGWEEAILVVCFGRAREDRSWLELLAGLAHAGGLRVRMIENRSFGHDTHVSVVRATRR